MTNTIFSILAFAVLVFGWRTSGPRRNVALGIWLVVSLLAFAQIGQKCLWAVLGLLVLQALLIFVNSRARIFSYRLFPLMYAAVLLTVHAVLKLNTPGFSYLVLSSSLDLWMRFNPEQSLPNENLIPGIPTWKERAFNLLSFPKLAVGPITSVKDHWDPPPATEIIFRVIFFGVLKAFILVNLWRQFLPAPLWAELHGPLAFLWFGLWNYVHLYLEFSGACDLVAAAFWLFGFGCPLNFDKPYVALTVSEFWKRWHVTLGRWIRNHVFIALGGSRVSPSRVMLNLFLAMVISGLWHGLTWNYLAWGAMQGLLLAGERAVGLENRVATMGAFGHGVCYAAFGDLFLDCFFREVLNSARAELLKGPENKTIGSTRKLNQTKFSWGILFAQLSYRLRTGELNDQPTYFSFYLVRRRGRFGTCTHTSRPSAFGLQ